MSQLSLDLPKASEMDEYIFQQPDEMAALELTIKRSPFDTNHKGLAIELGMAESTISDYLSGKKNMPLDFPRRVMKVCRNEVYLKWLAHKMGFGIVRLQSDVELENIQLREQIKQQQSEMEAIAKFLRKVKGHD